MASCKKISQHHCETLANRCTVQEKRSRIGSKTCANHAKSPAVNASLHSNSAIRLAFGGVIEPISTFPGVLQLIRSLQTEQAEPNGSSEGKMNDRDSTGIRRTPNSLGRWTQTFVVTGELRKRFTPRKQTPNEAHIFNPREIVEEISR